MLILTFVTFEALNIQLFKIIVNTFGTICIYITFGTVVL